MKIVKILCLLALVLMLTNGYAQTRQERLKSHVYFLASDSLNGRKTATKDAQKALNYLKKQYQEIGVKPYFDTPDLKFCSDYCFTSQFDTIRNLPYCNGVWIFPGNDSLLKYEYIIIGAHYDHLGKNSKGQVYNGADDNASGSAALVEIARELQKHSSELKRSVIIAAFDAEEIGLLGSKALRDKLPDSLNIKLMMSIDMVGWLKDGSLEIIGSGTIANGENILTETAKKIGIKINTKEFETSTFTATDTEPFALSKIPTLDVTTGLKSPYHKTTDDANLIDYQGMDKIVDYIACLTIECANNPNFAASGKLAPKHGGKRKTIEFGTSLSYCTSNLLLSNSHIKMDRRPGFAAALTLQWNISKVFALNLSAKYNILNFYYPNTEKILDKSQKFQCQYIEVPLNLNVNLINNTSNVRLYLLAGPVYYRSIAKNIFPSVDFQQTNANMFGYNLGFGLRLEHFFIENTWHETFKMLSGNSDPKTNMNSFNFSLGWWF